MPSPSYVPVVPAGKSVEFKDLTVTGDVNVAGALLLSGDVALAQGGTGIVTSTGEVHVQRQASTNVAFSTIVAGEVFDRVRIRTDGLMEIGPGSGARDTNLYRAGANLLKTDDKFVAAGGIGVGNSTAASTPGTIVRRVEIFDASGASLGFIPVYDQIT